MTCEEFLEVTKASGECQTRAVFAAVLRHHLTCPSCAAEMSRRWPPPDDPAERERLLGTLRREMQDPEVRSVVEGK